MIARIDGKGMMPIHVAAEFARLCFDDDREVNISTFHGEWMRHGYRGTVSLVDGTEFYGQWWFKRRGRIWAFHRHNEALYRCGQRVAMAGHPYERHGDGLHHIIAYADGYLAGLPRGMNAAARERIEKQLCTEIESILYE